MFPNFRAPSCDPLSLVRARATYTQLNTYRTGFFPLQALYVFFFFFFGFFVLYFFGLCGVCVCVCDPTAGNISHAA